MTILIVALFGMFSVLDNAPSTPFASVEYPLTPMAEQCYAEPRSVGDLIAYTGEVLTGTPASLPDITGTPADVAVVAEVEATLIELFACQNAGEPLRVYHLYTEEYLRFILQGLDQAALAQLATPAPVETDQWITIVSIDDVRVLADGRVYATVTLDPALIPVEKIFGFILVERDGRWLVDDVLDELEFSLP